jgi:hypothetical protein
VNPPGWVPPERLPDDLPPHEQWVREVPWEVFGAPAKHPPRTAPGYERAQRMGLLPAAAPAAPPTPLPGWSAGVLLVASGVAFVSPVLGFVTRDRAAWWAVAYALVGWLAGVRLLGRHLVRERDEAASGYTTTWGSPGLWRLTPLGRAVRPPDRTLLPDGFYPSPYWPGLLQKWEGTHWKPFPERWDRRPEQWVRAPERPYL